MGRNKVFAKAAHDAYFACWESSKDAGMPGFENLADPMKAAWIQSAAATVDAYQKATAAPALPDDATKRIAESLARLLRRDPQCDLARAIREVLA